MSEKVGPYHIVDLLPSPCAEIELLRTPWRDLAVQAMLDLLHDPRGHDAAV